MPDATPKGPRPSPGLSRIPRRETLASQAADQLRDAIVRGELETESPLREEELCRRLGISRIPLREALRRLEGEGFVEIRPRRGAVVAALSPAELVEVADMCRVLEARAIELAVPNLTSEVLERCAEHLDELDATEEPIEWARINWEFHSALYAPAQRPRFVETVANLRANAGRYLFVLLADSERRKKLNREHRGILAACRRGAAERAKNLLDAHLQGGKQSVMRIIQHKDLLVPAPPRRRR
jgi:DNA-binding GntR family transcriptional regulator